MDSPDPYEILVQGPSFSLMHASNSKSIKSSYEGLIFNLFI